MAAPVNTIGSQSFISIDGRPQYAGLTVRDITRPAVNGHAWVEMASFGVKSTHNAVVDVATQANALTKQTDYMAMQGSVYAVVINDDNMGYYMVESVKIERVITGVTGLGGINGGKVLVYSVWELSKAGV